MDNLELKAYLLKTIKNTPQLVKNKISYKNVYYNKRKEFYNIKGYIDNFLEDYDDDKFFLLPGLRGVGKTTIIFQLINYLLEECNLKPNQILYLNLDRLKNRETINLELCFDIFIKDINEKSFLNNEPLFIFVDELQHVTNWGLTGKIFFDETVNVFMLFSGSNALNLTTDKETARRSLKREVNPLTFSEYLNLKYYCEFPQDMENVLAKMFLTGDIEEMVEIEKKFQTKIVLGLKRDINKEWEDYVQLGGFPRTFKKNLVDAIDYTLEAKDKIVEKDIPRIVSLNTSTIDDTHPLLNNIALQRPGTLSEEKMSINWICRKVKFIIY